MAKDLVLITEGIADCYAAIQAGFPAISPATVRFRKRDREKIYQLTRGAENVYICNDNENSEAGEEGAYATAEFLESKGLAPLIVQLPRGENTDKVDLADFLKNNNPGDLRELMNEAKTIFQIAFEEMEADPENKKKETESLRC